MNTTFAAWIIIANVWIAAAQATDNSKKAMFCHVVGLVWLFMAIIYGMFKDGMFS